MTDINPVVQAALDAANRGDLPGFLACFDDDGVVDDWGREFQGEARITAWSNAEFIGRQVSLAVVTVRVDGDETVVKAQVGGNGFNGPSTFTFVVDGDRLSRMVIRA